MKKFNMIQVRFLKVIPYLIIVAATLIPVGSFAQYSGTYTIGGTSPDFPSPSVAVDSLLSQGVSGATTFNIRNGNYIDSLYFIGEIPGASSVNTITFQSEALDTSAVKIISAEKTIYLDSTDHVTFRYLSLISENNNVIFLENGATNNTFEHNYLQALDKYEEVIYDNYGAVLDSNITIQDNLIEGGREGVSLSGYSEDQSGNIIRDNIFREQTYTGIALDDLKGATVTGNIIFSSSSSYNYGIYAYDVNGAFEIIGNQVDIHNGRGFYIRYCDGTTDNHGLIANNMITCRGSNLDYGLNITSCDYTEILYNSVYTLSTNPLSAALYLNGEQNQVYNNIFANAGGGYSVAGNSITNSDYNLFYTNGSSFGLYNNNIIQTLEEWQTVTFQDINSHFTNPNFIADTNLHILSNGAINGQASPQPAITTDIDGETRSSSNPDIGADEFEAPLIDAAITSLDSLNKALCDSVVSVYATLVNHGTDDLQSAQINWSVNNSLQASINWTGSLSSGMSATIFLGNYTFSSNTAHHLKAWASNPNGSNDLVPENDTASYEQKYLALPADTYTIGGSSPDFSTFSEITPLLLNGGVCGPVIFNVRNGTYNDSLLFTGEIPGAASNNTITIQSESLDSSQVVLAANNPAYLYGTDHLIIKHLTITSSENGIQLMNGACNNSFENNHLEGTGQYLIYDQYGALLDSNNTYKNNFLSGASYGIYARGMNTNYAQPGTVIENNHFKNQYDQAIYLSSLKSVKVLSNNITTTDPDFNYGINSSNLIGDFEITNNTINIASGTGLRGYYLEGSSENRGLVANNMVYIKGNEAEFGMTFDYIEYTDVLYNSVHCKNTHSSSAALSINNFNNTSNYYNNIFANSGGGSTVIIDTDESINYNCYYTSGSSFGSYKDQQVSTFEDWQGVSGQDANSVFVNPAFESDTNLHISSNAALNGKAMVFPAITTDIDGELRDTENPDIGADEFNLPAIDAGIYSIDSLNTALCDTLVDIHATLINHGTTVLDSVLINWSVNSNSQSSFQWNGALSPGSTTQLYLGNFDFTPDSTYVVKAWTSNPNGIADPVPTNDTASSTSKSLALTAGTYTIGGTNPDFSGLNEAVDVLYDYGICGPVIFNVRPGDYSASLQFEGAIKGASTANTITFQSENLDTASVKITGSSGSAVELSGAKYLTFRYITFESYQNTINFLGGSENNTFEHNAIHCLSSYRDPVYIESSPQPNNLNTFKNNTIYGGSTGIYWYSSASGTGIGLAIRSNTFLDQQYSGIYLQGIKQAVIDSNDIQSNQDNFSYGIYGQNINNGEIRGNTITYHGGNENFYGIKSSQLTDGSKIAENYIYINEGEAGIENTSNEETFIYSNRIVAGGDSSNTFTGIYTRNGIVFNNFISISGSKEAHGIWCYRDNEIYHNSVNIINTSTSSSAFYVKSPNEGNVVKNNIFSNSGGGYAIYAPSGSSSFLTSDHNNLFVSISPLGYYAGSNVLDLNDWQAISNVDSNSVSAAPNFISDTNLHISSNSVIDKAGTPVSSVSSDIDNQIRDIVSPDIGADEFTSDSADAGIIKINTFNEPICDSLKDVFVTITNQGISVLDSVDVYWEINNDPQPVFNWSGNLASMDTAVINIGTYTFTADSAYAMKAWTTSPNGLVDNINNNDTLTSSSKTMALQAGTYTIGGTSPDFDSFNSAVSALTLKGVCGPVVFNIRDSIYDEKVTIPEIEGTSATNTITFQSESGDSSLVILTNSSTHTDTNYTVLLNGAEHIIFNKITIEAQGSQYSTAVELRKGAGDIVFSNNHLKSINTTNTDADHSIIESPSTNSNSNITFKGNRFTGGSNSIFFWGDNSSYSENLVIENNYFKDPFNTGVYVRYQDGLTIKSNYLTTNSTEFNFRGIYAEFLQGTLNISENNIKGIPSGFGINCRNLNSTQSEPGIIANNMIRAGNGSNYLTHGIYLYYLENINVFYNTVNVQSSNSSSTAFYFYHYQNNLVKLKNNIFSGKGNTKAVYVDRPGNLSSSNYNNLYTEGNILIAEQSQNYADLSSWQNGAGFDHNSYSVLPNFYADTNLHILSGYNLSGKGIPVSGITNDIDGDERSPSAPDIGADEFDPAGIDAGVLALDSLEGGSCTDSVVNIYARIANHGGTTLDSVDIYWSVNDSIYSVINYSDSLSAGEISQVFLGTLELGLLTNYDIKAWTANPNGITDTLNLNDTAIYRDKSRPLPAGTYTIGGTTPDFNNFTDAVKILNNGGICGPVIFKARTDTFVEQLSIEEIQGASAVNTITFESETGDSSDVLLTWSASSDENYTVRLNGTQYITFKNMSFRAENISYGNVFDISSGVENINIFNNTLLSLGTGGTSYAIYAVNNESSVFNLAVLDNLISGGYGGIKVTGDYSNFFTDVFIKNNTIKHQNINAISLAYGENVEIANNKIYPSGSSSTSYQGITLNDLNDFMVTQNHLWNVYDEGIYLSDCFGTLSAPLIVSNNFIHTTGSNSFTGIYVGRSDYVDIVHNSINIKTTNSYSTALYVDNNSEAINILNNILVNTGGGRAIWSEDYTVINTSDYNNLYASGSYIAEDDQTGAFAQLSTWQSATGLDANSVSIFTTFESDTNLHIPSNSVIDGGALPLSAVTVDIDNQPRDPIAPDIGADEFSIDTANVGIVSIPSVQNTVCDTTVNINVVLKNFANKSLDSVMINWAVNGVPQPSFSWYGNLPEFETDTVTIGSFNLSFNTNYEFKAWTASPNGNSDQDNSNDSTTVSDVEIIQPYVDLGADTTLCGNSLTLDAGDSAVSYFWSTGSPYQTVTVNSSGQYVVTVTGNCGIDGFDTDYDSMYVTLNPIPEAIISPAGTTAFCEGDSITLHADPVPSLEWVINGTPSGITGDSVVVDSSGDYQITTSNAYGCKDTSSITSVVVGMPSDVNLGPDTAILAGDSLLLDTEIPDGIYTWNTGDSSQWIYASTPGNYSVVATDSIGCPAGDTININYKDVPPIASFTTSGILCHGDSTGVIDLTVRGGIPPYSYLWSNDSTTEDLNGLAAGVYVVTITDSDTVPNQVSDFVTVDQPEALSANFTVSGTSCPSCSDGSVDMSVSGGTPPYSYLWSTGATSANLSSLPTGTYIVTITDSLGCSTTDTATVGCALALYLTSSDITSCEQDNGIISALTLGGTTPYSYAWSNGDTTDIISNLSEGTYSVTVTDSSGCQGIKADSVAAPALPSLSVSKTDVSCKDDNDGSASASPSGGTPPYEYQWGSNTLYQTTQTVTGLTANYYSVTVTDENQCSASQTVLVDEPDSSFTLSVSTNSSSCGNYDGSATAVASGGTAPYAYQWSNADTTSTADSLSAGTYVVQAIDNNGCRESKSVSISDADGPTISLNQLSDVNCNGAAGGSIDLDVSGGASPYTFNWSTGAITEDIANLSAGPYDIRVTDADGCVTIKSYTVNEPAAILISDSITPSSCGQSDGSISLEVSGGTSPYTYQWDNGSTSSSLSGIPWGIYSVVVTDSNGCSKLKNIAQSDQLGPVISVDSITQPQCGGPEGNIDISVSGGSTPYTYLWSTGASSEDISGVTAGTYSLTVADGSGCRAVSSIDVEQSLPPMQQICLVTVDTATGTNQVVWEKMNTPQIKEYYIYRETSVNGDYQKVGAVSNKELSVFTDSVADPRVKAWKYRITAVDSCGNESAPGTAHKTMHLSINLGLQDSTVNLLWDHYKGLPFNSYFVWRRTTQFGWELLDSLSNNTFMFTDLSAPVNDENLYYMVSIKLPGTCTATKNKNYNASVSNISTIFDKGDGNLLAVSVTATNADESTCNASATANPSGGTPPYSYVWSDPFSQTSQTATGLCANYTYMVTVTDANGFTGIDTVTISTVPNAVADIENTAPQVSIFPNPSSGAFEVQWSGLEVKIIEVFNLTGQQIVFDNHVKLTKCKNCTSGKYTVNTKNVVPGVYFVKIKGKQSTVVKKVVIQ